MACPRAYGNKLTCTTTAFQSTLFIKMALPNEDTWFGFQARHHTTCTRTRTATGTEYVHEIKFAHVIIILLHHHPPFPQHTLLLRRKAVWESVLRANRPIHSGEVYVSTENSFIWANVCRRCRVHLSVFVALDTSYCKCSTRNTINSKRNENLLYTSKLDQTRKWRRGRVSCGIFAEWGR